MVEFSVVGTVEMKMAHEKGMPASQLKETRFGLEVLNGLNQRAYVRPDGLPTEQGCKILTLAFIQGLVSLTHYGRQEKYLQYRRHVDYIVKELLRTAEHVEKMENTVASTDTFAERKRRSTHIDLVEHLRQRNTEGQYDELIKRAANFWYHDFKQPDDAPGGPKMLLVDDLSKFPELGDLRDRAINGYYDEPPGQDDTKAMAAQLTKHFTPKNPNDGI